MYKPEDRIEITRGYLQGRTGRITAAKPSMHDKTVYEYRITLDGEVKPREHSFRDADLQAC